MFNNCPSGNYYDYKAFAMGARSQVKGLEVAGLGWAGNTLAATACAGAEHAGWRGARSQVKGLQAAACCNRLRWC